MSDSLPAPPLGVGSAELAWLAQSVRDQVPVAGTALLPLKFERLDAPPLSGNEPDLCPGASCLFHGQEHQHVRPGCRCPR